ncbi:phage terminase large subunit-like protein [Novosphingobium sp. PhB165]|uniref:terminase large subunit n=1 Tax=Novosphingobium sp. PhB165 TaxID=2485105 RepID=UPI0010529BF3|nr:terminase TerL endonuclease subunit [Novosphingobium sp. PhB165]TCM17219.1 phage terminase large subunit-like protein [Novosphingobium sp. PhB165]
MAAKRRKTSSSEPADRCTQYARDVLAGKFIAGPHVRNACRRHLDDLQSGHARGLTYSVEKAERVFRFYEQKLRLNGGQFEGRPFLLHPSQAFKLGNLFGWLRADGTRRFRRAYIEEGKGNGKSPFAGGIGLYGMMADDEPGAEIYAVAAHRDQAKILFNDAVAMVDQSPDLAKRITQSGGPGRVFNLAWLAKGSFFRPLSRSAGKSGSGLRPHIGLADELHEHPNRDAVEMIERGFKFRRQPLLLMITNSGSDRNSICYEEHEHAVRVAAGTMTPGEDFAYVGEAIDDSTFSFVCSLDPGDDPLKDPKCWAKANPLLGTILSYEYLEGVVAQAKAIPGKLNGILRLHFCVWTDAEAAWMSRAVLEPCIADFDPAEHHSKRVSIGLDLSQSRDITAKANVVQTGTMDVEVEVDGEKRFVAKPTYDAWIEAWTPGDTLDARASRDKTPYDVWARQGHIYAPLGQSIRFDHVAQALADDDRHFEIAAVGYDRYAFRQFENECNQLGLSIPFVEHPQGGTKKGKPTDDMIAEAKSRGVEPEGLWMPKSLRELEDALLEGRIRLRRNPVLISAMMSAVTDSDRWENRWLAKERATNKIDAAVALCMAIGVAGAFAELAGPSYEMLII